MTSDLNLLAPAQVAALIAPTVDRLRLAVSRSMRVAAGQVAASYGLDPQVGALIAMVRNIAPDRAVTREDVSAIYVYQSPSIPQLAIAGAVEARLLDEPDDKRLCLTDRGLSMVTELNAIGDASAREMWGASDRIAELASLARVVARAAESDGGATVSVMAPPFEPAGASEAALLAERLTVLRFHRFDAHVAAWRAARLTAEQIRTIGPGPGRDAIEADTNRRAGTPYRALSAAERLALLAGLGSLNGQV